MTQEPPAAAELNLARRDTVLEVADHSGDHVVVGRIQIVNHYLRQRVLLIQAIQIPAQRLALRPVADGIPPGIRPHLLEPPPLVFPPRTQVELLGPALLR